MNVPTPAPEPSEAELLRAQIVRLCQSVPQGRVESYGKLGARCDPPVSGYVCGRVMGQIMDGAPWWRIVGKDGRLPISKRSPDHSRQQRERLEAEGVEFEEDGTVKRRFFGGEAEELALF